MGSTSHSGIGDRPTGLKETRELVRDLFVPRPVVYWTDLLVSAGVGWFAFTSSLLLVTPWQSIAIGLVAVLALYRALSFIHELTHLKAGALPGFSLAWNLLIGLPLLVPSFMYEGVHTDHHRRNVYGTERDPEYLPLAGAHGRIVLFLLQPIIIPLLFPLRFCLLSPLGWLVPPLGRLVEARASALVINPDYVRAPLVGSLRRQRYLFEVSAFLFWGGVLTLVLTERLPSALLIHWYLTSFGIAFVNQLRTLGAHRWRSGLLPSDVVGQLLDSVNVPNGPFAEVWAPVGLRYHALHHYLPDMPYHGLGAAHRRLCATLPADAPYRFVNHPSLASVVRDVWQREDAKTAFSPGGPSPCPSSTSTDSSSRAESSSA